MPDDGFKVSDAMWIALEALDLWTEAGVQIISLGLLHDRVNIQERTVRALEARRFVTVSVAGTVDLTTAGRRAMETHRRLSHSAPPVIPPANVDVPKAWRSTIPHGEATAFPNRVDDLLRGLIERITEARDGVRASALALTDDDHRHLVRIDSTPFDLSSRVDPADTNTVVVTAEWDPCVWCDLPKPKRRPFSNGTEERAWMSLWCEFCDNDHTIHDGGDAGCELVVKYLVDEAPDEWIEAPEPPFFMPKVMRCTQFKACRKCGDGGPAAVEERAKAPKG